LTQTSSFSTIGEVIGSVRTSSVGFHLHLTASADEGGGKALGVEMARQPSQLPLRRVSCDQPAK
jgi:hypothetical protein